MIFLGIGETWLGVIHKPSRRCPSEPIPGKRLSPFIGEAQLFSLAAAYKTPRHNSLKGHYCAGGAHRQYSVNPAEYVPMRVTR